MEFDFKALVQTFLLEAEEQLGETEQALMQLEVSPGDERLLQAAFRAVHTLKGNASSVGFQNVAELSHVLEEGLEGLLKQGLEISSDLMSLFLRAVDCLRESISDAVAGSLTVRSEHEQLLEEIRRQLRDRPDAAAGTGHGAPTGQGERRQNAGRRRSDLEGWDARARTLRVPIDRLNELLDLTGEITIARERLRQLLESRREGEGELVQTHREADRLYADLQELVMNLRMVPVGPTFRQFQRTVRDLAVAQGKEAQLTIEGGDVEVDMTVVEHLRDPLMHMVRNAIDHGIESPEKRKSEGKDPCGAIVLRASHEAGSIVVEVEDDGAGIDRDRVLRTARERGLTGGGENSSDEGVHQLIFEPGFSTARVVTELSGRGVGMDVVRRNVEALRGTVSVSSARGSGTRIRMRLPLTLAIVEGFSVEAAGESFVIPLDTMTECVDFVKGEGDESAKEGTFDFRGRCLPYVRLREFFELQAPPPTREALVVIERDNERVGLVVDELHGHTQTVIKPLGKLFQDVSGVSGSAIRGDGRVALVLDVAALLKQVFRPEAGTLVAS